MPDKDNRPIRNDVEEVVSAKLSPEECVIVTNLDLLGRARDVLKKDKFAQGIGRKLFEALIAYSEKKELRRLDVTHSGQVSGSSGDGDEAGSFTSDWRWALECAFSYALGESDDLRFVHLQRSEGDLNFMPLEFDHFEDGLLQWSVNYKPFSMSIGNQRAAKDLLNKYDLLLENEEGWEPVHSSHRKNGRWSAVASVPLDMKAGPFDETFVEVCWPLMSRVFDDYVTFEGRYSELPLDVRESLGRGRG